VDKIHGFLRKVHFSNREKANCKNDLYECLWAKRTTFLADNLRQKYKKLIINILSFLIALEI